MVCLLLLLLHIELLGVHPLLEKGETESPITSKGGHTLDDPEFVVKDDKFDEDVDIERAIGDGTIR